MADAIQCICETLNSAASHLATIRISEIRQSLDLLGVQYTEVVLGLLLFVLLQFTKFVAILLLATCMAYGIFYLWDTYFPGIAEFGHRTMKMYRNVRISANLPPFVYSDGEENSTPEDTILRPKVGLNPLNPPMMLPMLQGSEKIFRDTSLQTERPRKGRETASRGSRGRGHSSHREPQEATKHRQEQRHSRKATSPDRRSGQGTSHETKRAMNTLRVPSISSGGVDLGRLRAVTSADLKRLPNITSGESRKTHKEESRRLSTVTSGEMGVSRRVPKVTSHTNETPRWLNMASREVADPRRRSKSQHPQEGGESRRQSNAHGESKYRRPGERIPPHGRRPEEQPRQAQRMPTKSDEHRPDKQRRNINTSRSGLIRRQYPDDHFERLRMENRAFQARRLEASGGGGYRQSSGHPTSEGAMLTKQENFVANFRRSDKRESQRNSKSYKAGKDVDYKTRHERKKDPKI